MASEAKLACVEPGIDLDPEMVAMTVPEESTDLQRYARWLLDESGIDWLQPIYDQVREPDEKLSWKPALEAAPTKRAA